MPRLTLAVETFPIAGRFVISRGAKTEARVVTVTITSGDARGRGECVPYARYGESIESVCAAIESVAGDVEANPDRPRLQTLLPAGAARNAIDCALWDLDSKLTGRRAAERAGLPAPKPVVTAYTLSLAPPDEMGRAAAAAAHRPLLKIKLGGPDDPACLAAVRANAPSARLIVDANEGWRAEQLPGLFAACATAGVALIEQPLPAGADEALERIPHPVPVCADESVHDRHGLAALRARYEAVNVKLDKTGGLTEALALTRAARDLGFSIMIGCMVGSSLAMAPALLLAGSADFVDLDGPLLLAADRPGGLTYEGSIVAPPAPALWG